MLFIEQKGTNLLHVGHSRRETGLPFGHASLWQKTVDTEDIVEQGKRMKRAAARVWLMGDPSHVGETELRKTTNAEPGRPSRA